MSAATKRYKSIGKSRDRTNQTPIDVRSSADIRHWAIAHSWNQIPNCWIILSISIERWAIKIFNHFLFFSFTLIEAKNQCCNRIASHARTVEIKIINFQSVSIFRIASSITIASFHYSLFHFGCAVRCGAVGYGAVRHHLPKSPLTFHINKMIYSTDLGIWRKIQGKIAPFSIGWPLHIAHVCMISNLIVGEHWRP